ncbi:MAG: Na+/H+ antiporter subunit B [Halomonadaceae bacterium]|nr:MAG: Na+/H+ antiporter subunit B [Halomonadaceae bacterium]
MMKSNTLILQTAAIYITPLQLLFSVFLLLRGHDEPGGGFIAGLMASSAFVLYMFSYGVTATRNLFKIVPVDMLALGLILGMISGLPAMFLGQPFLQAQWWDIPLLGDATLKLSTPLIFDIGVYLAVIGTTLMIVVALMESETDHPSGNGD